ncbi:hypothetical protein [Streptomyces longisporoflavus]|uniref:Secreted protein n=1 Tax=Streptomyces longisporoflavus TaxID=28044 RepID=A0ABW7QTX2_9ACTN
MRKFAGTALAAVVMMGALGFTGSASAAEPQSGAAVTVASQSTAGDVEAQRRKCVSVKKWYTKRFNRMVRVKNSCGYKVCFSVTVAASRDPEFAIGARKTQDFRYGGIAWTKGTGVKRVSC